MLGQEVHYQDMEVVIVDMRMEVTHHDDIGKLFTFLLLTGYPSRGGHV
jgi:hypothetical protein